MCDRRETDCFSYQDPEDNGRPEITVYHYDNTNRLTRQQHLVEALSGPRCKGDSAQATDADEEVTPDVLIDPDEDPPGPSDR